MTAARTLMRYISWRFLLAIGAMVVLCSVLIFLVDFVELLRQSGKYGQASAAMLVFLTLLRLPTAAELVLPFAVLIGSIGSFLLLSRSSELVIARAAGMSAWQFILPGVVVAFVIGILSVVVYNPLAARARVAAEQLHADLFNRQTTLLKSKTTAEAWMRQEGADGQSVIHARIATDNGLQLKGVTAILYDSEKRFFERIEAESARLKDGRWELQKVWVSAVGRQAAYYDDYILSTHLTPTQVRTALGSVWSISFWELPDFIDVAEKAGLPATKYKLQYQSLLAKPFLLAVMVLLAATCSLGSFRFGRIQTMVLSGLGAGFAFFIFNETSRSFGRSGLAAPEVAAWAPVAIAALLASTMLLHQEDG